MGLLENIGGPRDLDALSPAQLEELAAEIRAFLVENVSRTGGHLGPNLGVVELTIALHKVFDLAQRPRHLRHRAPVVRPQAADGPSGLLRSALARRLAGYTLVGESARRRRGPLPRVELSWADGLSRALTRTGRTDRHVVAVVGDGALTGGMTWEALNNISDDNSPGLASSSSTTTDAPTRRRSAAWPPI